MSAPLCGILAMLCMGLAFGIEEPILGGFSLIFAILAIILGAVIWKKDKFRAKMGLFLGLIQILTIIIILIIVQPL
jgi:hypothetical protein